MLYRSVSGESSLCFYFMERIRCLLSGMETVSYKMCGKLKHPDLPIQKAAFGSASPFLDMESKSLQEIWAAATAFLSDLFLFITCKITQNPTSSNKQHTPFMCFSHYLIPSPSPLIARRVAGKAFTVCANNLAKDSAEQAMSTLKSFLQC